MIMLTNTQDVELKPGEIFTFDKVILKTGTNECHRPGSGAVKLCSNGIYEVHFKANITVATASDAVISMYIGGEELPYTRMKRTFVTTNLVDEISMTTLVKNYCVDYDRITIVNNSDVNVTIGENATLIVRRIA